MSPSLLAGIALLAALAEAALLLRYHRRLTPRLGPRAILLMLAPGLALMLTVLLATFGAGSTAIGTTLSAALLLHLADLWRRK